MYSPVSTTQSTLRTAIYEIVFFDVLFCFLDDAVLLSRNNKKVARYCSCFYFFPTFFHVFPLYALEQQQQLPLYFLRSIRIKSSTAETKLSHVCLCFFAKANHLFFISRRLKDHFVLPQSNPKHKFWC